MSSPRTLLDSFLAKNPSIEFIRYQWIDYCGILRALVLPVASSLHNSPFKLSPNAMTVATFLGFMPEHIHTGVNYIYPDFSSLRVCHYSPAHASVMCAVFEDRDRGFTRDPRTLLNNTLAKAEGLGLKVGCEIEFRCLKPDGTYLDDCMSAWWTTAALRNQCHPILEEVVRTLLKSGIDVCHYHTEGGTGVFEISTGPNNILQGIDDLIYCKETIKEMFAKHGILATTHPSPAIDHHHGLGAHFHLSVTSNEDYFLAGILDRLASLCAFAMPLEESYTRVNEFRGEAGYYLAWGTENRDIPIRQVKRGHWEIRCADGAANMYFVLASFIAAGLNGIKEQTPLIWKDFFGNPSNVDQETRSNAGIVRTLPLSLEEALDEMEKVDWKELGLELAAIRFVQMQRQNIVVLKRLTQAERRLRMLRLF